LKDNKIEYTGPLTGTLDEAKKITNKEEEYATEFDPIQTMWDVNPVDEDLYEGTLGYKDN